MCRLQRQFSASPGPHVVPGLPLVRGRVACHFRSPRSCQRRPHCCLFTRMFCSGRECRGLSSRSQPRLLLWVVVAKEAENESGKLPIQGSETVKELKECADEEVHGLGIFIH